MKQLEILVDREVFTPASTDPKAFVERQALNDALFFALDTPGLQVVVYGSSGSGKTTLLRKKLEIHFAGEVITQCTEGMTLEQLIINAFDQLNPFYTQQRVRNSSANINSVLEAQYAGIKAQLGGEISSSKEITETRALPPQLSVQNLVRFMGEAGYCWVLDDFDKITDNHVKKSASGAMKVFADVASDYPSTKIVIVGAVSAPYDVIEIGPYMQNRVTEVYVPLMTDSEIASIIERGEQLLNFALSKPQKEEIIAIANGHAAICHDLCLLICHTSGIRETQPSKLHVNAKEFNAALDRYVKQYEGSTGIRFKQALRRRPNSKFNHGLFILQALASFDSQGASQHDIYMKIREAHSDYRGDLQRQLKQLQTPARGALIQHDPVSEHYYFSAPIYHAYARVAILPRGNSMHLKLPEPNDILVRQKELKKALLTITMTSYRLPSNDDEI